ncbi:MAG: amino acid permease-associated region [Spartobacteria bacterium]|nr:amino acid permease-associated region [Spartobacteria bacterium]
MSTELDRAEESVEGHSTALKKELGLRDLVLTQIVFVVGTAWVGTAAKLGQSHVVYWLLAILLFYVPQAAVVIYLNRLMPLEGGLYQWAKLGFNEFAGFMTAWNLWLLGIAVMALSGLVVTTNISYAIGSRAAWMQENKWFISMISAVLVVGLGLVAVRGLSLGKWIHNAGGITMLMCYGALVLLPFISLARGELKEFHPLKIVAPTMSLFAVNIFSKLAIGGLSGFEYVAILAGETRAPGRNIGRSVLVAAPIIALMFILGSSSVLAFVGDRNIDLIGPVPQTLSIGFQSFGIAGVMVSVAILLMAMRSIALMSIYLAGSSRLPMVAGWDHLLPAWFTRLHRRYRTPSNSIIFVGAITLALSLASLIGVGAQEAFQLIDNAATIFYGVAYLLMFAIPLVGAFEVRRHASPWLRLAAVCGAIVTLLGMLFSVFPIVDVRNPLLFGAKIIAVALIGNAVGAAIFMAAEKRRQLSKPAA